MRKKLLIRCSEPQRRDALEESARLALAFVVVGTSPGFADLKTERDLEIHLSAHSLQQGCYLPETAQDLLEAVQAFGVPIKKIAAEGESVPQEWAPWWDELPWADQTEFEKTLEIV